MKKMTSADPAIGSEERALLNTRPQRRLVSGVDRSFKYRHAYLFIIVTLILGRLLFFPMSVYGDLGIININKPKQTLELYLQFRGFFALCVFIIYTYSYSKDWYFSRVALIVASMATFGFFADILNFVIFTEGPLKPVIIMTMVLRLGAIYCLFMNSIRDNRAPSMPRHMFS